MNKEAFEDLTLEDVTEEEDEENKEEVDEDDDGEVFTYD